MIRIWPFQIVFAGSQVGASRGPGEVVEASAIKNSLSRCRRLQYLQNLAHQGIPPMK